MNNRTRSGLSLVSALALIGLLPEIASGADLKPLPPIAPVPVIAPLPAWSGFYLGGHIGGAWTDWESETSFLAVPVAPAVGAPIRGAFPGPDSTDGSFLAGVQAGYNWQFGAFVLGGEADVSFLTADQEQAYTIPSAALLGANLGSILGGPDGFVSNWTRSVDWLATARLRFGYTVTPSVLLYATGGLAVGGLDSSVTFTGLVDDGTVRLVPVTSNRQWTQVGYAVGAGGEAALTPNISVKLEYLFADLGDATREIGTYLNVPCCLQTASVREQVTVQMLRFGVNYRFAPR